MLNIFYCHGFASRFDPDSLKVQTLARLGPVSGCDIDYTKGSEQIVADVMRQGDFAHIDVIVGTSMGGWMAAKLGASLGTPFVAINPAINPADTLKKHIGSGVDYQGQPYTLTEAAVASYEPIAKNGCGLILLDEGDEVLDSRKTKQALDGFYGVEMFPGGNHRFAHMDEALPVIEAFYDRAELVYGFDEG